MKQTNGWDVAVLVLWLAIYLGLILGSVYLIQAYGWSKWTLLAAVFLMPRIKT